MRKYDTKNKRNITIVLFICLIILLVFAVFIKKVTDIGKKEYEIGINSVLYDKDKNLISLESNGLIKIKWSGAYYLKYNEDEVALDKQVVVYNKASKVINLYGTLYKINANAEVETYKDENVIEDLIVPKFYKLADRKYLLIASDIKNDSSEFNANNYLIVELDKMGNATLTNDKINVKTLKATVLETSSYYFDIANEIINFGGENIDLKKIIGSTNLYEKPAEESKLLEEGGTNGGVGTSGDTINNEGNVGESTSNNEEEITNPEDDKTDKPVSSITDSRVYQDKNFSVVKNTIGTNYLSIDYSIYDPKSEYKNVTLEIENDSTKEIETYYLAKNGTNIKISRLLPNTKYNIYYKYSYLDAYLNVLYNPFDMNYSIKTLLPETNITVTKMTSKNLYYTISASDKLMLGLNAEVYINDELVDTKAFTSESLSNAYYGTLDITQYEDINYITIKVISIEYQSGQVSTNISTKVKY